MTRCRQNRNGINKLLVVLIHRALSHWLRMKMPDAAIYSRLNFRFYATLEPILKTAGITQLTKWILITGGIFCAAAVIVGAFGAHALKPLLSVKAMGWIETGVFYQMTHALALIACGLLPGKAQKLTALMFTIGIVLFSGSLYLMALTGITALGIITPLGGVSFIVAWTSFCWAVWSLDN